MSETTLSTLNGIYRPRIFRLTSTYPPHAVDCPKKKNVAPTFFLFLSSSRFFEEAAR